MPTHLLQSCVESPDGLTHVFPICSNANTPGLGSSMTPHSTYSGNGVMQAGGSVPSSCMFCDQTFTHQDELGPHVLSQHPTTFSEPTVLRVEAEFRIPGERPRTKPSSLPVEKEEVHSCLVCGHVSQDASELETHTRKHKDYFTYCCNVCGRRFREPWFLKNHMKKHVKPGAKSKAQQDPDTPVTINGIVQDPSPEPVATLYKMCMVCGFFFPDHDSLVEHSKVHNREIEPGKVKEKEIMADTTESPATQETFLHGLKLVTKSTGKSVQQERSSKWIPQLDPFITYQSWQLATKGKIAVGPNTTKDTGQEASTDNESGSDKEELNNICSEGQGDKVAKEGLGTKLRSQQRTVAENPEPQRRSLMQKDKDKERPTTCEECQRTFRTYHQLVLHSRVHKRESPPTVDGKLARAGGQPEEGCEEGLDEAALSENLGLGEEGIDRSKVKPKECTYCGKSFRSSYYLTVHLRTHTGEKPFKCAYCDYAAAQKTSLKYHLERRHKDKPLVDKPLVDIASRPVPAVPCPLSGTSETTEERHDAVGNNLEKPVVQMNADLEGQTLALTSYSPAEDIVKCPVPANLKMEDVKDESSDVPLNLSLKVSLSLPAIADPRYASITISCSFCTFKTLYPEVLVIHKNLNHKDKLDTTKKTGPVASSSLTRRTGCPPALNGKDVGPLQFDRCHPRRTKSPPRQPAKQQEKTPINPPHGLKQSPIHRPLHGTVQETQRRRPIINAYPSLEPSKYPELMRKSNTGSKYVVDPRSGPPDRAGISERSYPMRSGVIWHSDAARLCLSSQFGGLPQIDFGEPTSKRLKFTVPSGRQTDTGEKSGFRGPTGDGTSRVIIQGRSVKTTSQGPAPSTVPDNMGHMKTAPTVIGGLDNDWGMMNFLRSYTTNELASLYHSAPANPGHGGLANLNAGGRTVLYQHLPTLPALQRREPSGFFPTQRYGSTDKST